MSNEQFTEEEYCRMAIARLQRDYYDAIKPYVDRLVQIESMRVQPSSIIQMEITPQLIEQWGIVK